MPKRTAMLSSAAAPLSEPEQDHWPDDTIAFRIRLGSELCRILAERSRAWRHCPRGLCRRAHACNTQNGECPALPKREPVSEERTQKVMAQIQHILQDPEGFKARQKRHLAAHPPRRRKRGG